MTRSRTGLFLTAAVFLMLPLIPASAVGTDSLLKFECISTNLTGDFTVAVDSGSLQDGQRQVVGIGGEVLAAQVHQVQYDILFTEVSNEEVYQVSSHQMGLELWQLDLGPLMVASLVGLGDRVEGYFATPWGTYALAPLAGQPGCFAATFVEATQGPEAFAQPVAVQTAQAAPDDCLVARCIVEDACKENCEVSFHMEGDTLYCDEYGSIRSDPQNNWVYEWGNEFLAARTPFDEQTSVELVPTSGTCYFGASPYDESETNLAQALDDFKAGYSSTYGAPSESQLVHLFSGRDFNGAGVAECGGSYGLSDHVYSSSTYRPILLAHEIGHNFQASHEVGQAVCNNGVGEADKVLVQGTTCYRGVVPIVAKPGLLVVQPSFPDERSCNTIMWSGYGSGSVMYFSDGGAHNDNPAQDNVAVINAEGQRKTAMGLL